MRARLALHAPTLLRTVEAALAAALAWTLVQPWESVASQFGYYAPLGAVIGVSSSVASSVRGTVTTVRSLVVGAALGASVQLLPVPAVVGLAIVVGLGTLATGYRRLASGGPWIAYSAVFVLVVGGDDPLRYGLAYAGLTSFGAVVGTAVVAVLPPVLLGSGHRALTEAGATVSSQLADLARGLREDGPPTADQWAQHSRDLEPSMRALDDARHATAEAMRGNWRARWWSERARAQSRVAEVVRRSVPLVQFLTVLLTHDERADRDEVALGPVLRPLTAAALESWSGLLGALARGEDPDGLRDRAGHDLAALVEEVRRLGGSGAETLAASAVASTIRRGLEVTDEQS